MLKKYTDVIEINGLKNGEHFMTRNTRSIQLDKYLIIQLNQSYDKENKRVQNVGTQ